MESYRHQSNEIADAHLETEYPLKWFGIPYTPHHISSTTQTQRFLLHSRYSSPISTKSEITTEFSLKWFGIPYTLKQPSQPTKPQKNILKYRGIEYITG